MNPEIDELLSEILVRWQTLLSNKYGRTEATARVTKALEDLRAALSEARMDDELMDAMEVNLRQINESI